MPLKKRTAIIALISLACAFLVAFTIDEPIVRLISTIFLTNYVMCSLIIILWDIFQV